MSVSLQSDILMETVGRAVKSSNGEYLGKIAKVTCDEAGKYIEYLILESNGFLGKGDRLFAIPASSAFVKLTESKNVILRLSKDAMYMTKSIAVDSCPKPDFKKGSPLYELI